MLRHHSRNEVRFIQKGYEVDPSIERHFPCALERGSAFSTYIFLIVAYLIMIWSRIPKEIQSWWGVYQIILGGIRFYFYFYWIKPFIMVKFWMSTYRFSGKSNNRTLPIYFNLENSTIANLHGPLGPFVVIGNNFNQPAPHDISLLK